MRIVLVSALAVALGGCAAGSLVSYRLAPDHPKGSDAGLRLVGLERPVRITWDELGVPHIEAESELDLLRAVGFSHGRDRFFEMDMMRRFARGRVSELVGEQALFSGTTVDFDRSMRGWGMERRARAITEKLSAEERAKLEAYCAGVNAAVERYLPLEYRLLETKPAPWTVDDVWAVGLLNAWTVSHNWQQELARFTIALSVGIDRSEALYPNEPLEGGRTLPGDKERRTLPPAIAPELRAFLEETKPRVQPLTTRKGAPPLLALAGASNAWVVSGVRSKSGKPVLANDPHLSHLLPSLAYQQHLKAPGLDVIGMTIPGIPWVLMGHNDRVAWGITSTVADVMDLVVERIDPADPAHVLHEGGECALVTTEEELSIKGASPRKVTFRRTCNGPLLNDMLPELLPQGAPLVAVRWLSDGVEQSLTALARVNRARSVAELREAARSLTSPIQTFTAADVDGHIGTFISGTVPVRRAHRGTFPVPGWSAAYEWTETASPEALASGLDPESGFFAHANNLMIDPRETEVPIHVDAAPPYRVDRIAQRLAQHEKHDASTLGAIQSDVKLLRAERVMPAILEELKTLTPRDERDREALAILERWNFEAPASSAAAAIFFTLYREAVLGAIDDEVPHAVRQFFMSQRYSTNVADGWFERADHPAWDRRETTEVETRRTALHAAFFKSIDSLAQRFGGRPLTWRWGKLHFVEPKHPFGGKTALAGLVNLERSEAGGALDSIWKSHFEMGDERHPFKAVAGPVFRMVVDLADLNAGQWVIDTGSSGWPGSPHYGDQYPLWKDGKLAPMRYQWDDVRSHAAASVELRP